MFLHLSVIQGGGGGRAWLGGLRGRGHAWCQGMRDTPTHGRGCALQGGMHGMGVACMAGGRYGGVHAWWGEGHAWRGGVHVWQGWVHVWQERQPLQHTIRMLLDCILANIAYIILVCIPMCHTMNVNKKYENFSIKGRFL